MSTLEELWAACNASYGEEQPGGVEDPNYAGNPTEAQLVQDQYNFLAEENITNWEVLNVEYLPQSAFCAITYETNENQLIIAFEGTVNNSSTYGAGTLTADVELFLKQRPLVLSLAVQYARTIVKQAKNMGIATSDIEVTGHSLGGAEAEMAAWKAGLSGDSFGAPGIPGYNSLTSHYSGILDDYVDYGDPVGNFASDIPGGSADGRFANYQNLDHVGTVTMVGDQTSHSRLLSAAAKTYLAALFDGLGFEAVHHPLSNYAADLDIVQNDPVYLANAGVWDFAPGDILSGIEGDLGTDGKTDVASTSQPSAGVVVTPDFRVVSDPQDSVIRIKQKQSLYYQTLGMGGDQGTYSIKFDSSDTNVKWIRFTNAVDDDVTWLDMDNNSLSDDAFIPLHVNSIQANTLVLEDPATFEGIVSEFQVGDTIDLSGIGTATSATLGANNVLTVDGGGGGSIALDLAPGPNYADDVFTASPDGNGGTDVTCQEAVYNAADDFSITNGNPNGVWSYLVDGTLLTEYSGDSSSMLWSNGGEEPNFAGIFYAPNGAVENGGNVYFYPGYLHLDPQSNNNVSVQFTAPTAGSYEVTGKFRGDDVSETPRDVQILEDGNVIFSDTMSSFNQLDPFDLTVSLAAGDTIDFAVDTGSSYVSLGTGLSATIINTSLIAAAHG